MHEAYSFYCKIHFVFQNQEQIYFQMFFIHLNDNTLKTLLIQILVTKMIFLGNWVVYIFFPLPVGKI